MKHQCPICGEFAVGTETEVVRSHRKGKEISYLSHYSECLECELVFVTDDQMRLNNRALLAAEMGADGAPTAKEIRLWRKKHRLTQKQAGDLLGVGASAFSKYENYEVRPSAPTEKLLYVMLHVEEAFRALAEKTHLPHRPAKAVEVHMQQTEPGGETAELMRATAAALRCNRISASAQVLASVNSAKLRSSAAKHEITL